MPVKVRGHLGSELTRKASAAVYLETDERGGNSLVKVLKLHEGSVRGAGMFMFGWNGQLKIHISMGGYKRVWSACPDYFRKNKVVF